MMKKSVPNRKAGGDARAAKLSKSERSKIAARAAAARWSGQKLLEATHSGELEVAGVKILCHVLEDGTRLISQESINRAIGRMGNPKSFHDSAALQLPVFLQAKSLEPFVSQDVKDLFKPIYFKPTSGAAYSVGYPAETLPRICNIYLDAREADALHPSQQPIAERCRLLSRGFSEVGIAALVDEATGYQSVRARDALQAILDAFLRKEFAAWAKRFPDEFYREIYRLRGWPWPGMAKNRFQYVGKLTKDVIYKRLAPGVLEDLERRNPKDERGKRPARHHQWLTEDIGHPALTQHMHAVLGLMRASKNWNQFYKMLDLAFPIKGTHVQLELFQGDQPS